MGKNQTPHVLTGTTSAAARSWGKGIVKVQFTSCHPFIYVLFW